jgi:hypothetical protein
MKKPHPRRLVIALALLAVVFSSQALMAELTTRLVESPAPSAPQVNVDGTVFDGYVLSTVGLSVRNNSTNLLALDVARSALLLSDGKSYPLAAFAKSDFGATLLPGNLASGTIGVSVPVQTGDRLELFLAWTLGATVGSGTWMWEVVEAAPASGPAAATTAAPARAPAATAAAATQPTAAEGTSSDYVIGVVGLALGVLLLVLLGWGLWSLLSLP